MPVRKNHRITVRDVRLATVTGIRVSEILVPAESPGTRFGPIEAGTNKSSLLEVFMITAVLNWRIWLKAVDSSADSYARENTGNRIAPRMAMIAMTTY